MQFRWYHLLPILLIDLSVTILYRWWGDTGVWTAVFLSWFIAIFFPFRAIHNIIYLLKKIKSI